jgi:GTP-binding protein
MSRALLLKIKSPPRHDDEYEEDRGQTRLIFEIPTRGLFGYRGQFVIDTKGEGIISSRFIEFRPFAGTVEKQTFGSMISMQDRQMFGFCS